MGPQAAPPAARIQESNPMTMEVIPGLEGVPIAESAVNQVVSLRMAKKRQMRWTDAGAHRLVQVRVAVLNGEVSPSRLVRLGRTSNARSSRNMPTAATKPSATGHWPLARCRLRPAS